MRLRTIPKATFVAELPGVDLDRAETVADLLGKSVEHAKEILGEVVRRLEARDLEVEARQAAARESAAKIVALNEAARSQPTERDPYGTPQR
jgi:hypothetical protein